HYASRGPRCHGRRYGSGGTRWSFGSPNGPRRTGRSDVPGWSGRTSSNHDNHPGMGGGSAYCCGQSRWRKVREMTTEMYMVILVNEGKPVAFMAATAEGASIGRCGAGEWDIVDERVGSALLHCEC